MACQLHADFSHISSRASKPRIGGKTDGVGDEMVVPNNINHQTFSCPEIAMISSTQYLPLVRSKNFLLQKYVEEGLSPSEIAQQIFSCRSTVVRYLEHHGIELRAEDRSCIAGRIFGQRRVAGKVRAVKREQETIEKMIELRRQGHSYEKIANILNTMKIQTHKKKGPWYAKTVRQVLLRVPINYSGESSI